MKLTVRGFLILSVLIGPSAQADSLSGNVEWDKIIDLGMVVSGVIGAVAVEAGHQVKAGQLLVNMDPTVFEAKVKSAKAQLAWLRAEDAEQRRSLSRAEELFDRGVSSTVENDRVKLAANQARSARQQAEAEFVKASYERDHSVLMAPFDAWVLAVHVIPGQALANTFSISPVITIAEVGRYRVVVDSDLDEIESLKPGQSVRVMVNGLQHSGRLTAIERAQQLNRVRLKASFRSDRYIAPGSVGTIEIP